MFDWSTFLQSGLTGAGWVTWLVYTLVVTHITIVAVTVYLHRSQAHRALDVHPALAHFFRFWLWMTTGMSTRIWASIHRKHHAKCETDDDPHSPQRRGISVVFWRGAELYRAESKNPDTVKKYGHGTPDDWMENKVYVGLPWQGVGATLIINFLLFGFPGVSIWAIQMLWIPVLAAGVINGIGHYWGYRNFNCPDASTNIFPIGILIGGEELHNNHHTFATSAKLSNKWYEFDIGWLYIRLLAMLGLAKVKKVAPKVRFQPAKSVLDFDSVQAVINYRYDVLARYARTIKTAYKAEFGHLKTLAMQTHQQDPTSLRDELRLLDRARQWLHIDQIKLSEQQRAALELLFLRSEKLRTLYLMREELASVWERSHWSREQMVQHLQQWVERAEASGIRMLADLSQYIRRYRFVHH